MPSSEAHPQVSIGVPVYNGENYLRQALDSILAQTYTDWEVVICDNASTDSTRRICEEYTRKDGRFRYFRNASNLGAARNYNRTFDLSRGKYFKWNAHDDVCAPLFLERCVAVLDADPTIALCYPRITIIGPDGLPLDTVDEQVREDYSFHRLTDSPLPQQRLRDLLPGRHRCYQVFGLMRSSVLRTMTPLQGGYAGGDDVFLIRIGLRGRYHELEEPLLLSRDHPQRFIRAIPTRRQRTPWFDTSRQGAMFSLPDWRIWWEIVKSPLLTPLPVSQRFACLAEVFSWTRSFWGRKLWEDLVSLVKFTARSSPIARSVVARARGHKIPS